MRRFFLLLLLTGCTRIVGQVEAHEPEGEHWTLVPDRCFTGQKLLFNGVELESAEGDPHALLVVTDPVKGPSVVVVDSATHTRVVYDASTCRQLDANVYQNGARIEGHMAINGSITLACGTGEKWIRGSIAFENCH